MNLRTGDRVRIIKEIDNYPTIRLPPGDVGTIAEISDDCWWVKLDRVVPELVEWDNSIEIWDWHDDTDPEGHPSAFLQKIAEDQQ